MSFGSDIGTFLTSSDEFSADLIINDAATIAIDFDSWQLTYKQGDCFFIRLGRLYNSGPNNELTLRGRSLEPGCTYPISPALKGIAASFTLENYTRALPANYSGKFIVESVSTNGDGSTTVTASFSIYFQGAGGKYYEVRCSTLRLST